MFLHDNIMDDNIYKLNRLVCIIYNLSIDFLGNLVASTRCKSNQSCISYDLCTPSDHNYPPWTLYLLLHQHLWIPFISIQHSPNMIHHFERSK